MVNIMNVETAQKELDKRFPKGTHVRVDFGGGTDPVTFLIPRAIVLDEGMVLISPMNETRFHEVEVDDFVVKDKTTIVLQSGTRTWTLTPASEVAQRLLSDRLEGAFRAGLAEEFRGMRAKKKVSS